VYRYAVQRRVSVAFLLAMFQHESGMGKAGTATITHSWGNTRLPVHGGVTPVRLTAPGEARSGQFPVFKDWIDGGIATVARFVDYAPYRGKTTVRQIIPTWAPATDLNDPDAYSRGVLASIEAWVQQGDTMAPQITQKLTNVNYWQGRNGLTPKAVVIHTAEGSRAGVDSWFHNPAAEASAHYLINKDGSIWQFVREADSAWANGKLNRPNLSDPLIAYWSQSGVNPNRETISIETERMHTERLTAPQLAALAWLVADIHRRYGWPKDGSRLLGHNEFDSVDRALCPSLTQAEWGALIAAVQGGTVDNAPSTPARPDGYMLPGQADTFLWPDGEGVIVYRKVRYYNPQEKAYYEREWGNDGGYTPWVRVA
jgi:N-acetyl-anhydromuramyl-L-alanine amidase AmpD